MPRLLPDLLFPSADFSIAELHAARLDGELTAVDAGFAPLDCPSTVELRLRALAPLLPESAIVERQSALWAYGFRPYPPLRHQACVHAGVGRRVPGSVRLQVREVVLAEDDIVTRYGVPVTSLLRTAVDLARSLPRVDDVERGRLREILVASHVTLPEATAMLDRCRSMPNKRRAMVRLTEALAD
ncbi:hypothetical protein B7R54_09390 [Subtercola boreus]|uniref:AbiEi antitoxin C-terminal domain-containing protein n=1 Tax=Subtercola boreus TaxID=120213 RepID=A0A3E0VHL1_9MICO|nr:hypothetical protein [Subtercola boreus]RFA09422.1 hypothetical protein B7R54_09390 [Subtercola boreus]TQL53535.1 hypothetical protein FB464_1049 [Subtercola boreus]